jgi:hypothetical protein
MINNYYDLYLKNTLRLAETIVMKFSDAAQAMNRKVVIDGSVTDVDEDDPSTWKYYQNISGQYHANDYCLTVTYSPYIIVRSLDKQNAEIDFTKEELAKNPITRQAYSYGSRFYKELIKNYPNQELLIMGILYAPDDPNFIQKAIDAPEGTILYYPEGLVEEHESSFISKLQEFVYNFMSRWVIRQYGISDELYPAVYLGQLFLNIIPAMFNIRLRACKTNEAHTYHIREYLSSHGMLDKYLTALTREQALFLYRNLLYIEVNAGKRETFAWLVDNIMTKRGLPVYEYNMKHNVSQMFVEGQVLSYTPDPEFVRRPINFKANNVKKASYEPAQLLEKMNANASGNPTYHAHNQEAIIEELKYQASSTVATKVLESTLEDLTNPGPYTLEYLMINHFLAWGLDGTYVSEINFSIPGMKKAIKLTPTNAVMFYLYAMAMSVGIVYKDIPYLMPSRILRNIPKAQLLQEMISVVDKRYTPIDLLEKLVATSPSVVSLETPKDFYNKVKEIHSATFEQFKLQAIQENEYTSGQLELATSLLYADVDLKPRLLKSTSPDVLLTGMEEWLDTIGVWFYDYTEPDFFNLATELYLQVTGLKDHQAADIKKIQGAMIEVLKTLSSYSIQFISDVKASPLQLLNDRGDRMLDSLTSTANDEYVEEPLDEVVDQDCKVRETVLVDDTLVETSTVVTNQKEIIQVPSDDERIEKQDLDLVTIHMVEIPELGVLSTESPALAFDALTADQKRSLYQAFMDVA